MRFVLFFILGYCVQPALCSAQLSAIQTYDTPLNELEQLGMGTDSEILVVLYEPQSAKHQQQLDAAFHSEIVEYFNNGVAVRLVDKNSEEGKAFALQYAKTKINVLDKTAPTFYLFHSSGVLFAATQDDFAEGNLQKFAQSVRLHEAIIDKISEAIIEGDIKTADIKANIADIERIGGIEKEGKIKRLSPALLRSYKKNSVYSKDYLADLAKYDDNYLSDYWQVVIKQRKTFEKKLGKELVSKEIKKIWYKTLVKVKEQGYLNNMKMLESLAIVCEDQIPELYEFSNAVISYWQYEAGQAEHDNYEQFKLSFFQNHAIDILDIAHEAELRLANEAANEAELKQLLTWIETGLSWDLTPYAVPDALCTKAKILLRLNKSKEAKAAAQKSLELCPDGDDCCAKELIEQINNR